jgi:uncharacterized delta-60 repeat protein
MLAVSASVNSSHVLNITGTSGNDTITVNKLSNGKISVSGVSTQFQLGTSSGKFNKIFVNAGNGNDKITINNNFTYTSSTISGAGGNDTLTGGKGNDSIDGDNGNDTLSGGGGGADLLRGDAGFDTANYSDRTDNLTISLDGNANDGGSGGSEHDNVQTEEVICGSGNDTVNGSSGDDFIAGGAGKDVIDGNGGNDNITGSTGQDKLLGDEGDDFIQAKNNDQDTVGGGENSDGSADFDLASVDGIDVPAVGAKGALGTFVSNIAKARAQALAAQDGNPSDLDSEYGDAGKALGPLVGWDEIAAAAVDSQGRVIFVGSDFRDGGFGYGEDMVVCRFNADGSFDDGFNDGDGEQVIDFSSAYGISHDDFARGVTIAPDDSIIVVGSSQLVIAGRGASASFVEFPTDSDFAVAKLDDQGFLDDTFGNENGKQTLDLSGNEATNDVAYDAAVQADGKIVIAGDRDLENTQVTYDPAAEFSVDENPDGPWSYTWSTTLDGAQTAYDTPTSAEDGRDFWTRSSPSSTSTLAPDVNHNGTGEDASGIPDGTIALEPGFYGEVSHIVFTAPRSGTYDIIGSFLGADQSSEPISPTTDVHVIINGQSQFDGSIDSENASADFELTGWFLNAGDTVDFAVGYGDNGNFDNDNTALSAEVTRTSSGEDQTMAVARVTSSGGLDFDGFNFGQGFNYINVGNEVDTSSIALQTLPDDFGDQRIVVGGDADGNFTVARFLADGEIDFDFGENGGYTATTLGFADGLSDIAVDADNNIFAVGAVSTGFDRHAAGRTPIDGPSVAELVKYDSDGNFIDNVEADTGSGADEFNSLTIDDQGRIVAVGDDGSDYLVARYKNDLSFDSSFADAPVTTDFTPDDGESSPSFDTALGVRVLDDGHIVVGGASAEVFLTRGLSGENAQPSAARYLGDQEPSNPFDIEEFVDVENPNEDLQNHLADLSTSALLYITSVPDADGNVTIDLGDGGDNVSLTTITAADGTKQIAVTVNGITLFYDADTTNSIKINGNAGPDKIVSDSSVKTTLLVAAGSGDDTVTGGGGRNLLFGQSGNDSLSGGSKGDVIAGGSGSDKCFGNDGNDIVIGGPNNDSVNGGNGEDIVVAGSTVYDSDIPALTALLDEWTSSNSNSTRISNLRNGTGANAPFYLAGASLPTDQRTVFDDQAKDTVTGGSSRDWFFGRTNVATKDSLTDKGGSEEFDQI